MTVKKSALSRVNKPVRLRVPKRVIKLAPSGFGRDWDEAERRMYKEWGKDLRKLAKDDD
ncbi:MAG: hypothetical protein HY261_11100 [Chloroflexi bacterium]|nr:hypothetical protein [Chloroflexota bacterium]